MGTEFYLYNQEKDEYFELGKGQWTLMFPSDAFVIPTEYELYCLLLQRVAPTFAEDVQLGYFKKVTEAIHEWAKDDIVKLMNDSADVFPDDLESKTTGSRFFDNVLDNKETDTKQASAILSKMIKTCNLNEKQESRVLKFIFSFEVNNIETRSELEIDANKFATWKSQTGILNGVQNCLKSIVLSLVDSTFGVHKSITLKLFFLNVEANGKKRTLTWERDSVQCLWDLSLVIAKECSDYFG